MPDRSGYALNEFQSEIDQVDELCQKYTDIPTIVACDFNIDLHGK